MKTLLLADDSVTIQRVIELSFAHEDVRVVSVSDGRRALQWMESEAPDIVLTDVAVPEVDGYALAKHVKESSRLRGVPVLLLAGAFEPVDQDRVRSLGCDGVLVKPFEPQQLVNRVKTLLQKPAAPAESLPLAQEYGRRHDGDLATVTPFPGTTRTSAFASSHGLTEPEPLEPPARPVWEGTPAPASRIDKPEAGPAAPPARVSLANAFSALLAAEQSAQPAPVSSPVSAAAVSEERIEEAVKRVLSRMTDDQVKRIVTEVAERLVREEIEKIKARPE